MKLNNNTIRNNTNNDNDNNYYNEINTYNSNNNNNNNLITIPHLVSIQIEKSINEIFDFVNDKKHYLDKARSLQFNLKKNEVYNNNNNNKNNRNTYTINLLYLNKIHKK